MGYVTVFSPGSVLGGARCVAAAVDVVACLHCIALFPLCMFVGVAWWLASRGIPCWSVLFRCHSVFRFAEFGSLLLSVCGGRLVDLVCELQYLLLLLRCWLYFVPSCGLDLVLGCCVLRLLFRY